MSPLEDLDGSEQVGPEPRPSREGLESQAETKELSRTGGFGLALWEEQRFWSLDLS